jgi:CHAD domain-containing protein
MLTGEAFRETARGVVTHLISNLAAAHIGNIAGVHQARVALRRLRALLQLYAPLLGRPVVNAYDEEFRRLGGIFGAVRDWDVFEKDIIGPARLDLRNGRSLMLVSDIASERRAAALEALRKESDCPKFTYLIIGLLNWINSSDASLLGTSELDKPISKQMPLLLDRIYHTAKKRRKRVTDSDETMHGFRKSMKKMRYAVEYSEHLWNQRNVAAFIKPCKKLQTRLGESNDIVMAGHLIDKLVVGEPSIVPVATELQQWLLHRKKSADKKALATLKKFDTAKPYWK